MIARAADWSRDLAIVLALAVLGAVLAVVPGDGWIEEGVLLVFILFLPGYAATAALFPPRSIPVAERTVYAVALSVALTGLSGVVVQLVLNLDRDTWIVLLMIMTAVGCLLAQLRREWLPPAETRIRLFRVNPAAIVMFLLAAALAGVAFSLSVTSTREMRADAQFAQLWILPAPNGRAENGSEAVSIGVANHLAEDVVYRLELLYGTEPVTAWTFHIGKRGEREFSAQGPQPLANRALRAVLLRDGRPYREAFLRGGPEP